LFYQISEREKKKFYRIDTWKNQVWVKGTYKLVFIVNSLSQGTGTVAKKVSINVFFHSIQELLSKCKKEFLCVNEKKTFYNESCQM